ncbi:hypothetical protein [Streptomyces sp. NPDC086787]|uniref:hypothetical protein n=1 Tax=Streptomyces sp. NPDC086787 TaxID=3365759 RepID=UPI00381D5B1C
MNSFAHRAPRQKRSGSHHGYRPRNARMRHGSRKSGAQLRALNSPARNGVRAELRAARLSRAV